MSPAPLTTAYIAIGAAQAIAECGHEAVANVWRGAELHLIETVIAWAEALELLADQIDLAGCFAYEVAEPFGKELTLALLTERDCDVKALAGQIASRLTQEAQT